MLHTQMLVVLGCLTTAACAVAEREVEPSIAEAELAGAAGDANEEQEDQELSIGQHTALTIDREASRTYRIVAYGDSIFAGYYGSLFNVARRAAPYVAGEYFATAWDANVEVVRRTRSGAFAKEIYERTILSDRSWMADPSTRIVYFEMCGNDYLDARKQFARASGRCNLQRLDDALATCTTYMGKAMEAINTHAPTAERKAIANLYYPGFNADVVPARCTDPSGARPIVQEVLLPYMARSNWRACALAKQHGFACVDAFAEMMGSDWDANGDGVIDIDGLRYDPEESEEDYVTRITVTLRGTIRDANEHETGEETRADYLQDDDIHPSYYLSTVGSGTVKRFAPDFEDAELATGKTRKWNQLGHERMGFALWQAGPAILDAAR